MANTWHNPANWECSLVPDEYVDAVIPSGKTNYPTITSDAKVFSLETMPGSAVRVTLGVKLEVRGQ